MALLERLALLVGCEQWLKPRQVILRRIRLSYALLELSERCRLALWQLPCIQRGAVGGEGVGPARPNALAAFQPKANLETPDQVGNELERSAKENDLPLDGPSACEPGNRLAHDGLKDACRNVALLRSSIQEGAHVGLREHGASRRNRVDARRTARKPAHIARAHAKHEGNRVDEPARSSGTGCVHPLFGVAREIHHLRVLATKLDDGVGVGVELPHGALGCQNFLHKRELKHLGERDARRSGDGRLAGKVAITPDQVMQNIDKRLADVRKMAAVNRVHHGAIFVDDHDFHGLRPCVDSEAIGFSGLLCRHLSSANLRAIDAEGCSRSRRLRAWRPRPC